MFSQYNNCTLCPRSCGAKRNGDATASCEEKPDNGVIGRTTDSCKEKPDNGVIGRTTDSCEKKQDDGIGICGVSHKLKIARAALHMWEEPCISGERGSGAVFFSGCSLHCVFCQNRKISGGNGKELIDEELVAIFLRLQEEHAANINLVTPTQYVPTIAWALREAKTRGLTIPVVYNTSGYETVETLRQLDGLVDIYLPDFKYMDESLAATYSKAKNYPQVAKEAIAEMVRQVGEAAFSEEGYMTKGIIVRHLCLPGEIEDSKRVLRYLYETYGNSIYYSIMNQYTPPKEPLAWQNLNRKLTEEEYDEVVDYAIELGVENGFIQEGDTAEESFIPEFEVE